MNKKIIDFSGWATRNDLLCSDGRTIKRDAFKHNDGQVVPLVWNHNHTAPDNVLGHALLENREEGVYAYCTFNDTEAGQNAKKLVSHGDVRSLSIYANQLKQSGGNVLHGAIREVSLVLSGANPGAFIDSVMSHSNVTEEEGLVVGYDENLVLYHKEENVKEAVQVAQDPKENLTNNEETVGDVFNSLSEKQKTVVYALIGQAIEDAKGGDDEEDEDEGGAPGMKHNVFENDYIDDEDFISHSEMTAVLSDAKRYGSLRDSALAHGITDIAYMFPDAVNVTDTPGFIKRDDTWVTKVLDSTHHTPFSRIKSIFADITAEDARAKGYLKGKLKKEEVFSLLKRTTTPTTIYKKQKLDRDDVIDITDFDVVAFLKKEMRTMLDEEIARAVLVGDGRLNSSDDKINEQNIRPIWKDAELYTIKAKVETPANATEDQKAKAFIRTVIKSRKDYQGSGDPVLYTTEDVLTDILLLEDTTGRAIYDSTQKVASVLRVKEIVTVPVMEGLIRTDEDGKTASLMGIIVNLKDYNIGADKGGAINMFDDFDIDYNAQKYLIETRCSGALIKPYSAIAIEQVETTVTP